MCIVRECEQEGTENLELSVVNKKQLVKICTKCFDLIRKGTKLSMGSKSSKPNVTDIVFRALL